MDSTMNVKALAAEVIGTFMLMASLAIGPTLAEIHIMAIPISKASVNLARSLASALCTCGVALSQVWHFRVAPGLGGVVGGNLANWLLGAKSATTFCSNRRRWQLCRLCLLLEAVCIVSPCGNSACDAPSNHRLFLASGRQVCEHPGVPERRGLI